MIDFGEYKLDLVRERSFNTNCYVLVKDKSCILVDAAGDGKQILDYIHNKGFDIKTILITHGHFDHIEALDALHMEFGNAPIFACKEEKIVIENIDNTLMKHELKDETLNFIQYLNDLDIINALGLDIKLMNTPGHTIGSSCYYVERLKLIFSGDTLFRDTYGRTDLPTGNFDMIVKSVTQKLMKLSDEIKVYPGHGLATTIGEERLNNDLMINNAI